MSENTYINPECFNRIVFQQQPICERHKCEPKNAQETPKENNGNRNLKIYEVRKI